MSYDYSDFLAAQYGPYYIMCEAHINTHYIVLGFAIANDVYFPSFCHMVWTKLYKCWVQKLLLISTFLKTESKVMVPAITFI